MKISQQYASVSNTDVVRSYWTVLKKRAGYFYGSLLMIVIASGLEAVYPLFYKHFFDILSAATGPTPDIAAALTHIIFIILGLHIIAWIGWRVATFTTMYYQAYTMADIKTNAFRYIARHSQTFFSNTFIGSLVQKVSRAAKAFETIFDTLSWNFLPLFVQLVVSTIILFTINTFFAWLVFSWSILFVGFNFFFAHYKLKFDIKKSEADSRTTGALADALTNHASMDLFTGHAGEQARFTEIADDQGRITHFSWRLSGIVEAVQSVLVMAIEFSVFYFGIRMWVAGTMTVGTFVLIQAYIISLSGTLWNFGKVIRGFYEAFADGVELVQILHTPHDILDIKGARKLEVTAGEIAFDHVGFAYGKNPAVFHDLSMTIKPGERVALVGASGAGKSTVISLLLRFHDVTAGAISIDGQDIRTVTQDSLHHAIAMVPQDTVLFHRTLRENIRYGRPDATDAEIEQAAKAAHCEEFISRLPHGYDTYVGERGVKLSGGERQRVAIARAILKRAPILVLDEATSSLDSHSESLIQEALGYLMEGRTTLVIAHRLSTIRKMDRIIVLEKGAVVEDGTHDQLLANPKSLYKKLWDLQVGGFYSKTWNWRAQQKHVVSFAALAKTPILGYNLSYKTYLLAIHIL